jgi:hypothetical protein
MVPELIRRRDAAQATLNAFIGQPLVWGRFDCVRLAAFNLRQLGYKPRLVRGGAYRTPLGARQALKRAGFKSLEAALDDLGLPRVGHARILPGDVVALASGEDWPSLSVYLGNGRVLAFSAHHQMVAVAQPGPSDILDCWSARPCLMPS